LAVATRHGASNLRIYGSIATGHEPSASDLDRLVDLPDDQSLLGLISLRQDLEDLLGCFRGYDGSGDPASPDSRPDLGAGHGFLNEGRRQLTALQHCAARPVLELCQDNHPSAGLTSAGLMYWR
jgi:hypothetical protein